MGRESRKRLKDKDRIIDFTVFVVMLAAVSVVTLILFHRQTLGSPQEGYHSDMKAYILKMQGLDSGYNFPYPIFFKLAAFIHLFASPEFSVALATMLLNSLAIVIVKLAVNRLVLPESGEYVGILGQRWLVGILLSLLSVSLFFISMLYPPAGIYLPGIKFNYLGVFTPNPFHNATYMAARPFGILAFLWYVKLLPEYEKGIRRKAGRPGKDSVQGEANQQEEANRQEEAGAPLSDYIWFSAFLLAATMTKPSFTIVLVGTAGLIMLFRLLCSKFRNFIPTIQLGLCFIPTFIDLLYQYRGVFMADAETEGGIGFGVGDVWGLYCDNIPLAMALAVGFPLMVLVLNFRELKRDMLYRFSWQIYLMSFAMALCLYEKGFRKVDFNFSWGYMYGIFFCHLGALLVLLRSTVKTAGDVGRKNYQILFLTAQWLAYLWHVACGLFYFRIFWLGGMYY